MHNNQFMALIKKKRGTIVLFGLLIGALSFFTLVLKEESYKVSTDYLITQNQTGSQDFYTLSKSAQYAGKVLNEGIYSEVFIGEVINTSKVNAEFLPFDKKDKLKTWSNAVQVTLNPDLGIMSVQVFDNDQKKAQAISAAIAEVLTTKSNLFYGEGQNINVKILSGPVPEKNPSILNIIATSTGGFALGVMFSILWIVTKEDRRKNRMFSQSAQVAVSQVKNPIAIPAIEENVSIQEEPEMIDDLMSDEYYLEKIREMGRN